MIYASFWKRFLAFFLDILILIIPAAILNALLPGIGSVIILLLYKPVFEASPISATPGKALIGLAVVTEDGSRLSLKTSFLRYLGSLLTNLTMGIGYLIALFTDRKQTLHDLLVKSVVVYRPTPDVNFFNVWMDELKVIFGSLNASGTSTLGHTSGTQSVTAEIESLFKLYKPVP